MIKFLSGIFFLLFLILENYEYKYINRVEKEVKDESDRRFIEGIKF